MTGGRFLRTVVVPCKRIQTSKAINNINTYYDTLYIESYKRRRLYEKEKKITPV